MVQCSVAGVDERAVQAPRAGVGADLDGNGVADRARVVRGRAQHALDSRAAHLEQERAGELGRVVEDRRDGLGDGGDRVEVDAARTVDVTRSVRALPAPVSSTS